MPKLRNRGPLYRGWDPGRGVPLYVKPGEEVEVSDQKAAQLLADFPGDWELVGAKQMKPRRNKMIAGSKRGKARHAAD